MNRLRLYRLVMGSLGVAFFLFGAAMVVAFFLYQRPNSTPIVWLEPFLNLFSMN